MIEKLRNENKVRNDDLDNALINHWKGVQRDESSKKQEKVTARTPYMDRMIQL